MRRFGRWRILRLPPCCVPGTVVGRSAWQPPRFCRWPRPRVPSTTSVGIAIFPDESLPQAAMRDSGRASSSRFIPTPSAARTQNANEPTTLEGAKRCPISSDRNPGDERTASAGQLPQSSRELLNLRVSRGRQPAVRLTQCSEFNPLTPGGSSPTGWRRSRSYRRPSVLVGARASPCSRLGYLT